ncbi:YidC/Oxa1 family membrane protein insertase [Candidatus Shapirobacteria bacterium]|nr:YidC/Oxa1 family membrane protein insertase [Candidatus Shapirobacteria bacterium]
MSEIWHLALYQPLVNGLILFYKILFSNLGLAIIALTLVIRALMVPLTAPSLKAAKKMQELAPELEKLKKKHEHDKQALARAQLELYQRHGANPAAGCLPQIIQFIVLIALYQAFSQVLRPDGVEVVKKLNEVLYPILQLPETLGINLKFLYLDLGRPDLIHLPGLPPLPGPFLVGAALVQFLSSKMMSPVVKKQEAEAKKTPQKEDDMATMMQKQMLYMFPLMTLFIGFSFPSGLVLYWLVFSVFQLGQQYFLNHSLSFSAIISRGRK